MKRMLALLLTAMLILTLLPGCGKKNPGGDAPEVPENPTEQGGETPDVTPEPEPYVDPYEAVRTYWSEDQLTQSWGPDQIVEHLFFHPVIAYPQWAFHDCGASQSERYGLDDWMVTADEYAKILQSVYEKGYILVAIEDVWSEVTDESGTHMVRNTLKLPEGKKPLIISFDDVNYYPYMLEQGFTSKLVVGEDGEIWAECTDPYTKETFLTKEGDATTMLDEFVYEHPDFSLNGAKAIFSLTGYYGILGYRTQDDRDIAADSPDRPAFDAFYRTDFQQTAQVILRKMIFFLAEVADQLRAVDLVLLPPRGAHPAGEKAAADRHQRHRALGGRGRQSGRTHQRALLSARRASRRRRLAQDRRALPILAKSGLPHLRERRRQFVQLHQAGHLRRHLRPSASGRHDAAPLPQPLSAILQCRGHHRSFGPSRPRRGLVRRNE